MGNNMSQSIWDPDIAWCESIESRDKECCIRLLQISGWELLTAYLNGGLGKSWWCYPIILGVSRSLENSSLLLVNRWNEFCTCFDVANPFCRNRNKISIEDTICTHYNSIATTNMDYLQGNGIAIAQNEHTVHQLGKEICDFRKSIDKIRPYLLSYWLHGSVGSDEVKPDWSDLDGLAIVSSKTLGSPRKLKKLRKGLICAKSYMTDFMPYQLHGHFILAEPDLKSYPSSMFPRILFSHAK